MSGILSLPFNDLSIIIDLISLITVNADKLETICQNSSLAFERETEGGIGQGG